MRMSLKKFVLQDRGPYLFDCWQWPERVCTALGNLVLELETSDGEPPPDVDMVLLAEELSEFAESNGALLVDLIYGHYRFAEEKGWLSFWGVGPKLSRNQVLSQVRSVELRVWRGDGGIPEAEVFVDPRWDPEHKLDLIYSGGRIVAINEQPFFLDGDVLRKT